MNIIGTSTHAKLDYPVGLLFMASPWIFGFTAIVSATWTPVVIGFTALIMSLFTDYEGGMVRSIPMRVHLTVDMFSGIFLGSSPWILGFADQVFLPHLIMGVFELVVALLTSKHPTHDNTGPVVDPNADGINNSAAKA